MFVIYAGPKIFLLSMAFQKFNDIMKTSLQKKIEERMHDLIEGKYEERNSQSKSFTPSNVKQQYGKHGKHGNIDKSCENFYLILQNTDLLTEWLGDKARQWMDNDRNIETNLANCPQRLFSWENRPKEKQGKSGRY